MGMQIHPIINWDVQNHKAGWKILIFTASLQTNPLVSFAISDRFTQFHVLMES